MAEQKEAVKHASSAATNRFGGKVAIVTGGASGKTGG